MHIIPLFRIGGSYGQKGVIQREAKVKRSYVAKLDDVCMAIAREGEIRPATTVGDDTAGGWFHHTGRFKVAEPVTNPTADAVVTLVAGRGTVSSCSTARSGTSAKECWYRRQRG